MYSLRNIGMSSFLAELEMNSIVIHSLVYRPPVLQGASQIQMISLSAGSCIRIFDLAERYIKKSHVPRQLPIDYTSEESQDPARIWNKLSSIICL